MSNKQYCFKNEYGAVFPFLATVAAALIMVTALVIDLSQKQLAARHAQNCADAASLAASSRLNGQQSGFRDAKRAALSSFRQCIIYGARENIDQTPAATEAARLADDAVDRLYNEEERFKGTLFQVGNVELSIKRGAYWDTTGWQDANYKDGFHFISFENTPNGMIYNLPVYLIANAVEINVAVQDLDVSFAGIFGYTSLGDVNRHSVAALDHSLEDNVAPLAIPACALMLDTNPSSPERYQTEVYRPAEQCQRELIFTEIDPRGGDTNNGLDKKRLDGVTRADTYPLQPIAYFNGNNNMCVAAAQTTPLNIFQSSNVNVAALLEGEFPNCKALPIEGIMGVPSSVPVGGSTAQKVKAIFQVPTTSWPARLGNRFEPLENRQDYFANILNDANFSQHLDNLINNTANPLFTNVFEKDGKPTPNFPHLRHKVPVKPLSDSVCPAIFATGNAALDAFYNHWGCVNACNGGHFQYPLGQAFDPSQTATQNNQRTSPCFNSDPYAVINQHTGHVLECTSVFRNNSCRWVPINGEMSCGLISSGLWSRTGPNPVCHAVDYRCLDPQTSAAQREQMGCDETSPTVTEALQLNWPISDSGNGTLELQNMGEGNWSNPMCHSEGIPFNDRSQARAREMKIMVIAPSRPGVNYCDFEHVFAQAEQGNLPPEQRTYPIVVGFVKAHLFDFNLTDLDARHSVTADEGPTVTPEFKFGSSPSPVDGTYRNNTDTLYADNAARITPETAFVESNGISRWANNFLDDAGRWFECRECQGADCPPCSRNAIDIPEPPQTANFVNECFNVGEAADRDGDGLSWSDLANIQAETRAQFQANALGSVAAYYADLLGFNDPTWGKTLPDTHCIPRKINDCFPISDRRCWEQPQPRQAGWGCGGLRMRLSCEPDLFPSTTSPDKTRPTIVYAADDWW